MNLRVVIESVNKFVFWSERSGCAALGHCRQNVVATIKGVFSLSIASFFPIRLLFSQKDCLRVLKLCKRSQLTKILGFHTKIVDSCTDILYYYKQLVLMKCTSVYTTHINGTHTQTRTLPFIFIDSCTDIL